MERGARRPEQAHAEDIRQRLEEEGVDTTAPADDQLCYVWSLFLRGQEDLRSAARELEKLRHQQAEEMREVENYVGHVRTLTEARDALATECERENEQFRMEFAQLQLEHESQQKEVEEMLEQEGLLDIAHSSPSEQVAYLLVERSALLEKIEALERKPEAPCCSENLCAAQLQVELDQIRQTLENELQGQREAMQHTDGAASKSHAEELARESALHQGAERDLHEAAHRLQVAQGEIRRLTEELEVQRRGQGKLAAPAAVTLEEEMEKAKESGMSELQKAEEHKIRLDKEILTLRNRVQFLDSERKIFFERDEKGTAEAEEGSILDEANSDRDSNHKRCRQAIAGVECQKAQLLHKLRRLEREHEDLVERNEELESLLGETQNRTKDERERFECEAGGLQRKISRLEAELSQAQKDKSGMADGEMAKKAADCLEELHNLKSEVLRLYSELQVLRGATEGSDSLHVNDEKLQQAHRLLETKVSKLSQECEPWNWLVTEEKKDGERFLTGRRACAELMVKERVLEDQIHSQEEERERLWVKLLESNKKTEELEKQLKGGHEENQLLWEENAQLRKDILALQHQFNTDGVATGPKHKGGFEEIQPRKTQSPIRSADGDTKQGPPGERLLQQQEELQQLRQDIQRVQNLCGSAEKELRYEREKNLELKKHNILLQQENIKAKAELRQAQLKLCESSEASSSLTSQWELSRQKVMELELELLRQAQATKQQSGWQEKLAQEKARVTEAEDTIADLQQKLKESHHRVRLSETHILGRKQLEEDMKEAREKEMKAQRQFQEEQRKRKLLDQQTEELLQQLRHSREKETQLARTFAELQVQCRQQEAQLRVLEEEKKTLSNEHLHCQKYSQKLSEQLLALQQEKETLHEECGNILKQVDVSIRKHNERQLRHKAKLRRAKETFICEVRQRDVRIRDLENETKLSKRRAEKDHGLIRQVTTANESLLQEKRKLLLQLHDAGVAERSNKQVLSTVQSRVQFLDEENKQLQEQTLQLATQVGVLERALRSIHSPSLEELKSLGFFDCQLQSKTLPLPSVRSCTSFPVTGLSDSCALLKARQDSRAEDPTERSLLSLLPFQPSEIDYLNVASLGDTADVRKEEPSQPSCWDHV